MGNEEEELNDSLNTERRVKVEKKEGDKRKKESENRDLNVKVTEIRKKIGMERVK